MSNVRRILTRRTPLRAVPDEPSLSLARAREAVDLFDQGEWTPGLTALAEAWYLAVVHGERCSEEDARAVMRGIASRWWTPGDGAA